MRTFDKSTLHFISLFELITGVAPMDCVINERVYFVVPKDSMAKILTKKGEKIKMLERHTGKQAIVFPYAVKEEDFVKNVISEKVKIGKSDKNLRLIISRMDSKRVKRDSEAIKSFLERIYNVENVVFRY